MEAQIDTEQDAEIATPSPNAHPPPLERHYLPLPRSYKSDIWNLFRPLDPHHHPPKIKGDKYADCRICHTIINYGRGSSGLNRHMSSHEKNSAEAQKLMETLRKNKRNLYASLNATTKHTPEHRRKTFLEVTTCWVVEENIPLNMVEKDSFRRMCETLDSKAPKLTQRSIREEIKSLGDICKQSLQRELSDRYFALTTDHWTSKNNETYGALTAHYIDNYQLKRCVLHFEVHHGTTSGQSLFSSLLQVFESYNFDCSYILAVTTDTTGNMNTFGRKLAELGVIHLYCIDHNLHLNAKMAFDDANLPESGNAMKVARAQVQFFNSSTQALDKLCNMQQTTRQGKPVIRLLQDVQTRWWSTWKMLNRLLELTPTINALIDSNLVNTTPLTSHQEQVLREVEHLLTPIQKAQERLEGDKYPTISTVPFFVWKLRKHLKEHITEPDCLSLTPSTRHLANKMYTDYVNNRYGDGSNVFNENYKLGNLQRYVSIHKIALVAAFLDPRFKNLKPFLPEAEHSKVHQYVLAMMQEHVRNNSSDQPLVDADDSWIERPSLTDPIVVDDLFAELAETTDVAASSRTGDNDTLCSSELKRYIDYQLLHSSQDPLLWWKEHSSHFPILEVLALKYLCIPATSASSERLWSLAALIITKTRTQLDGHLVADMIFLKENGHILERHAESIEGRVRVLPTVYEQPVTSIEEENIELLLNS
jgi:hypothetical protein